MKTQVRWLLLALLPGIGMAIIALFIMPGVACASGAGKVVLLNQGWSDEERQIYYTTSQGAALLSYDVFRNLEQAESENLFRTDANMSKYGLIPQPVNARWNPDGWPIGWTKTVIPDGRWRGTWVGLSCAACHNAQLEYKGTKIRIDGGFSHSFDFHAFIAGLDDALTAALNDSAKFTRMAKRMSETGVRGQSDLWRRQLESDRAFVHSLHSRTMQPSFAVGPGRMDALSILHNQLLSTYLGFPENWMAPNAPVKWPFLWNAPQSAWIGWRGTQQFPLQRNVGESMALSARTDLTSRTPEQGLFDSTADIAGQIAMEDLLRKLAPPPWPEEVLGKIDREKAARGKALFAENCASCHSVWPHRWSRPKVREKRFIENALIPASFVGTDPTQTLNVAYGVYPTFFTGAIAPYLPQPYRGSILAPEFLVLGTAVAGVTNKAAARLELSPERLEDVSGFRYTKEPMPPTGLYKAAPRDGSWAIAPYLHNGSVPNLYELLLPAAQRSKKFFLGGEFDPIKVGVDTSQSTGSFLFDTTLVGNSNAGHSFEDGPQQGGVIGQLLADDERWALIEYLKSIPTAPAQVSPFGGPENPVEAWKDSSFYHVQHTSGYQGRSGGDE